MANSTTVQLLVDGPGNCVVKIEGVLDTSDLAATGQIGASGFTTTLGSRTIVFVAGALVPMVGQFLTFSDTTTTFNAGTYVTSIVSATSVIVNNPAKAINAAAAITITGTAGSVVLVDPALLSNIWETQVTSRLTITKLIHNIEDLLSVNLFWDATTPVRIEELTGRGKGDYHRFGGLVNNAGAGVNGRILISTQGWVATTTLSFSLILELKKS